MKRNIYLPLEYKNESKFKIPDLKLSWQDFIDSFTIDNIQGIFKFYIQKQFDKENTPTPILYNTLCAIMGNNRFGFDVTFNLLKGIFNDRIWFRRVFTNFSNPLFFITSIFNPHNKKDRIISITSGIPGTWLNFKNYFDRQSIALSKSISWTPFSLDYRKELMGNWKKFLDNNEMFETTIPFPPTWEYQLPSDLAFHSELLNFFLNYIFQISRYLRYFMDIQFSTIESQLSSISSFSGVKNLLYSKFYEQFYFLLGMNFKSTFEYSWNEMKKTFRIPLMFNWGCELFRIWFVTDLYWEYKDELRSVHSLKFIVTLFEVYTLCEFRLSLDPFYSKIVEIFKWLKKRIFKNKY